MDGFRNIDPLENVSPFVPLEVPPEQDPQEKQIRDLLIKYPNKRFLGRSMGEGGKKRLGGIALKVSGVFKGATNYVSEIRRNKGFADSVIQEGTQKLKQGIDEFTQKLKEADDAEDARAIAEDARDVAYDPHEDAHAVAYPEDASARQNLESAISKRTKQLGEIYHGMDEGMEVINQFLSAGKSIESLVGNDEFETAIDYLELPNKVREELNYLIELRTNCNQMTKESKKLSNLQERIQIIEVQLASLMEEGKQSEITQELKDELIRLIQRHDEQQIKVESMREELTEETVSSLIEKGEEYLTLIQDALHKGTGAYAAVSTLTSEIGLLGSLITLSKSIKKMHSIGDSIEEIERNEKTLKSILRTLESSRSKENDLIYDMYTLKINHLNKSKETLKQEVISAAANVVSSSLKSTEMGIAFVAVLSSTVIATPGLNIAATAITAITAAGIKAVALRNKLERDREGVKLDIQIAEESARLVASAGQFYSRGMELNPIRARIEALLIEEQEIIDTIDAVNRDIENIRGHQRAERFYAELKHGLKKRLLPLLEEKVELHEKYGNLLEELSQMNQTLNKVTTRKQELKGGRSMQNLALEFSKGTTIEDIVKQKAEFDEILKDENVKKKFVEFLIGAGIPILEGHLFESVLAFIRDDKRVPKPN